ncbi:MAG: ATP-binding protein [Chloroflexota bacterium]
MSTTKRQPFSPPVFPGDDEKTRIARTLNVLVLGCLCLLALTAVSVPFLAVDLLAGLLVILLVLMAFLVIRQIMLRGLVSLASALFVLLIWAGSTVFTSLAGGMTSIIVMFYLACTVIMGLLLGVRAALFLAVVSGLAGAGMVVAEASGTSFPVLIQVPPYGELLLLALALFLTTITFTLALRSLNDALAQARDQLNERRKADEALQRSEIRYRTIVSNLPLVIFTVDSRGVFTLLEGKGLELLGLEPGEIIGRSAREMEADIPEVVAGLDRALSGEAHISLATIRGVAFETRYAPLTAEDGTVSGVIGLATDISDRTKAEEEIQRHAEELEAIFVVSTAMRTARTWRQIIQTAVTQVVDLLNGEGAAIGVYNPEDEEIVIEQGHRAWADWTGKRISAKDGIVGEVVATGKPFVSNDLDAAALAGGPGETEEVEWVACVPLMTNEKVTGLLWFGCSTRITEKELGVLTAIADMTANAIQRQSLHEDSQTRLQVLQETQSVLIQNEKLAAIGRLISGVAHELNNPLTSIVLYSQMLQRQPLKESVKADLDKIVAESGRASKIVRGLLDFARQRPPERTAVNVNEVLSSVIDLVAYELRVRNISTELDLAPELPYTMADPHQLQQVFFNLVTNAWQAISTVSNRGKLTFKTEVGRSIFPLEGQEDQPVIRIAIGDDGPGIPEDIQLKIFDPFYTTKPEGSGTGLGLSICHGVVSEHGGTIRVESEAGKGATFTVELPVVAVGVDQAMPAEKPTTKPLRPARILVIDDERYVLEILTRALRTRGYYVEAFNSALDGFKRLEEEEFDLILCDMRMPEMSGPNFYRQIQTSKPELARRIVFITGDVVNPATQSFIKQENVVYLSKPFELSELYRVVHRMAQQS